ncbi:Antibiotic efflux pump outer membrane protein ArpC [Cupriavidus pampae]|uniref:Antibiotic efflux pump outer membrane protein ArpC n=1 Tax=Cupriavidus pampae TaxID=659251 RepID=A0ABN7Z9S9_9BURK|nr:Antibiotic efflux pump outer membrane protein ArpC [Cupriavidus pampae]
MGVKTDATTMGCGRLARGATFAVTLALSLMLAACAVGPDYRRPTVQIPAGFKEGVSWQRAQANPAASISSTWWRMYQDDTLDGLVERALKANQSIVAAEAAYRVALATVQSNTAALFPIVTAGASGTRTGIGGNVTQAASGTSSLGRTATPGVFNSVSASLSVNWELDLWGGIRRQIESAKTSAQASDAQLAGVQLSIAASVVLNYFALRQADYDIDSLTRQQNIDSKILEMTRASYREGASSSNDVLVAQDVLDAVIANLQASRIAREQDEHAIAVLTGVPPAAVDIASDPAYTFRAPQLPLALPSQLLERRYDVVSAERLAASANAKIGAAVAAFFPDLTLSTTGGFQSNTFARLFSLPSRFWTLGPDVAATIFDAGVRSAAVTSARASYDEQVATYRNTVLTAFQSVEDSLSSINHLRTQEQSSADILHRNQQLFATVEAQRSIGTSSEEDLLDQQLTLIEAEQSLRDTQSALAQSDVTLIKNLGGGWSADGTNAASTTTSLHVRS